MADKQEFLDKYADAITIACEGTGIFPSVKIAQAALETGWGKSIVGNNMFGIKATGSPNAYWHGDSVSAGTKEYDSNGNLVPQQSAFRKYATVSDSIRDHNLLLIKNSSYANVLTAKTPEEQAKAIQDAGYAGRYNTTYANALISIINANNLKKYDKKKNIMKWIEITAAVLLVVIAGYLIYKNSK